MADSSRKKEKVERRSGRRKREVEEKEEERRGVDLVGTYRLLHRNVGGMTEPEAYLATSQTRSSTSCDSAYSMHSGYLATTLSPPLGRMGARIAAMAHHSNDGNHAGTNLPNPWRPLISTACLGSHSILQPQPHLLYHQANLL